VLTSSEAGPRDAARLLLSRFTEFAPPDLLRFERRSEAAGSLETGETLEVVIRALGTFSVRVVHQDQLSVTLVTETGHPEAGRITFGAYPNGDGEAVLHIRSRARAGSPYFALVFPAAAQPMQTTTWTGFLDRWAAVAGGRIRDVIHEETREVSEEPGDRRMHDIFPTFRAVRGSEENRSSDPEPDGDAHG